MNDIKILDFTIEIVCVVFDSELVNRSNPRCDNRSIHQHHISIE